QQVCSNIVDLNKNPEPTPEPVTTIALEAPPVVEQKPEPAPQEQPEPVKTDTAMTDLHPIAKKEPEAPSATAYFACADANLFKKLFDAMRLLQTEVTFKFDMDSLTVRHMDPGRVAMFGCTINKEVFEEWNVTKPGLCCFNAEEVKKVVFGKPLKKDTIIGVSVDGEHGRVTFTLKDNRVRERSFPTLETSLEEIPTPKIAFNASYKITAKEFAEDIEGLTKLSDHVVLIGTNEAFKMDVEGDYAKGNTTYKRGDNQLLDIELKEESKATYSLSYLKDFVDPTLCDLILIEYSTDMPLKLTMLSKFGDLIYYLAPRIETD
ncbi:hypothetical protein MUP77_00390, partial [Candidatus Bathyarchaeota archaeon]|nr:hypothetical protein [Candidatus Bathyarchaeota archaeon]